MFSGCRRALLHGEGSSFQKQHLSPKICTSSRRCKTTKIRRKTSPDEGEGTKPAKNIGWKGTPRLPKPKASNLPAPFGPPGLLEAPTSIVPTEEAYPGFMYPFSREPVGRPIPEIKPPPGEWKDGAPPPEFIVDLDLPPEKRWAKALEWGTPLLRRVVYKFNTPEESLWNNELMQGIERRYQFSNDQYAEMQGIAAMTNIPFHKIRDYNLTLTLQFGCTSGTVPLIEPTRLLHFRVLDPAIALPQLLIQAHFIRRGELVASAIMHLGHVAITTGVRRGLSISINTKHDYVRSSGFYKWWRRWEWAMYDPWCISTRDLLLRESLPSLSTAKRELARGMPDAFFSVVSDGRDASSLDGPPEEQRWREPKNGVLVQGNHYPDFDEKFMIDVTSPGSVALMEKNTARVRRLETIIKQSMEANKGAGVEISDLLKWITSPPVKQSITTLACIMDPTEGDILWAATYRGR